MNKPVKRVPTFDHMPPKSIRPTPQPSPAKAPPSNTGDTKK
ncbi:hypothetical protein Xcab_02503 [Xenorhabdus cabanillasii JM26]|nr:hypothetical protein Xcab_02503 [Xenorhabdus cabanillasii JM26]